jgi:hypothetical protein
MIIDIEVNSQFIPYLWFIKLKYISIWVFIGLENWWKTF